MPDIGGMELLVIAIVALIVVGPKDLPMMFRKVGQFTGKIRGMAKDFQRAMDQAADDAGMSELNRDLKAAGKFAKNPTKAGMDAFNETVDELGIDPSKYEEGSETRKMAEAKVEATAKMREEVAARRQAQIDKTIADKQAAAVKRDAEAGFEAPPAASPVEAAPEPAPTPRTGTDQT